MRRRPAGGLVLTTTLAVVDGCWGDGRLHLLHRSVGRAGDVQRGVV
jgi:hypothetical protein